MRFGAAEGRAEELMARVSEPAGERMLTLADAFLVMEEFVVNFGERDGWSEDGLRNLADFVSTSPDRGEGEMIKPRPADPAMWHDWLLSARAILPDLFVE